MKNENNTDISLYQIYLPNLQENILKYYWFNLFKEIFISFNYGFETISKSSVRLSDCPHVELVNAAGIFAFNSSLMLLRLFFGLSLNHALRKLIKGDYNLECSAANYLGWCGRRNFLTAKTRFSCLSGITQSPIARCRISCSHPLNPGK